MSYSHQHLQEAAQIISQLDPETCERAVRLLGDVRARGGRLFILGVGGSAANASHAVNDFRKIAGFESYAPTDNVSELTARTNDEGWPSVFAEWLKGSRLNKDDALLVLSVGGGDVGKNISANLVAALQLAKERGASILGPVGRDGWGPQQTRYSRATPLPTGTGRRCRDLRRCSKRMCALEISRIPPGSR